MLNSNISTFYNLEYEKLILGAMLIDNTVIDDVIAKISAEDFFSLDFQEIFNKICENYRDYGEANILTVCTSSPKNLSSTIAGLTNDISTSANIEFYIKQVLEYSKKRKQKRILQEQLERLEKGENVDDNIHNTDSAITGLMKQDSHNVINMQTLVPSIMDVMKKNFERKSQWLGYDSGWTNLNDILDGLREGKLIIVGARPSMGKSAFALQLAANISKKNVPSTIFSFEMDSEELGIRLASFESGVSIPMIEHGFAAQSMNLLQKLNTAFNRIYSYPLSVIDEPLHSEKELYSLIRVQAKKERKKVFIVDHLGLLHHSDYTMKRYEQVGDITIRLHHLAKELGVTIIVLCQLKRDAEGKKPSLSDLRESGDIEQNADVIMFIHRARAQGGEIEIPTEIIVDKNRGGRTGTVRMNFIPDQTKFVEDKKSTNLGDVSDIPNFPSFPDEQL